MPGGEVVWFDHEMLFPEEDDPFPNEEGMVRLGETFAAFVEGLTAPPSGASPPPPAARGWWQRFFGG